MTDREMTNSTGGQPRRPSNRQTPFIEAPATATVAGNDDARARGAAVLVAESIALGDAYAQVLDHALTQHNNRVKPDEVKAIFLTAVINLSGGKTPTA
jgi:hypothetical protein